MNSGNYQLLVRSRTGSNQTSENYSVDSVRVEVSLPVYKEPNFHYYALGAGLLFLLLSGLYFAFYLNYQHRGKVKEQRIKFLQVHTLQSQLNPHFLFNVLGTIQSYIKAGKFDLANGYLLEFSKLIRRILDSTVKSNSMMDTSTINTEISLNEEIELLKGYIGFEKLQYSDKFNFKISLPEEDIDELTVPPMIIQPFVENAIKHGLMYRETCGMLNVRFYMRGESLICEVEDNGVGRARAAEMQKNSIKIYKSRGIDLVKERIAILNTLDYDIKIFTEDILPQGTKVTIFFNYK